jgi:hypothetical protein
MMISFLGFVSVELESETSKMAGETTWSAIFAIREREQRGKRGRIR